MCKNLETYIIWMKIFLAGFKPKSQVEIKEMLERIAIRAKYDALFDHC